MPNLIPEIRPRKRRKLIVYDLEWYPDTAQLRLVGVKDRSKGYRYYQTIDSFLDAEMTKRNHGAWFGAHAGGLADILFVLPRLIARGWICSGVTAGSSLILVKVRRGRCEWTFVDTYWILKDGLAKIGKCVGLEKLDCAFDAPLGELITYNERDCEILLRGLERCENELWELGGQLKPTVASCALELFRRAYLDREWSSPHVVSENLRSGYFGGRVEVIDHRYIFDGKYYDINSSFPFAMTRKLPGTFLRTSRTIKPCSWVLATVKVDGELPALPWRSSALYFPTGQWTNWFYCEELDQFGIDILDIHKVYEFEPRDDLADYVWDIYERRRKTTDDFLRMLFKYWLNGIYGKFAERTEKYKLIINPDAEWLCEHRERARAMREEWMEKERALGNDPSPEDFVYDDARMLIPGVWNEKRAVDISHEHVALAGAITGVARKNLRSFMLGARSRHYCDTDGFSTLDTISTSDALGALKLEKEYKLARFAAPKIYHIDGVVRAKGFPIKAIAQHMVDKEKWIPRDFDIDGKSVDAKTILETSPELRLEIFGRIVNGDTVHFSRMPRVHEQLSRKMIPDGRVWKGTKHWRQSVRPKRKINWDWTTEPWSVDELEE